MIDKQTERRQIKQKGFDYIMYETHDGAPLQAYNYAIYKGPTHRLPEQPHPAVAGKEIRSRSRVEVRRGMHVARISDDRRLRADNRKIHNADIALGVFSERGVVGECTLEVGVNLGQGERVQVGRQIDRQTPRGRFETEERKHGREKLSRRVLT